MATKSDGYVPDAGDIVWLEFDPTRANEQRGGCTLICIAEGAAAAGGAMTVQQTIADSPDPLRLGGVQFDLAFLILIIAVQILINVALAL